MEGQKNCSNPDGWSYNWTSEKISIKVDRGQLVELLPIDDLINQGLLYRWTEHLADLKKNTAKWGKKAPLITPRGWIFWTIIFYHQKIQVKIYLMRGQT